MPEKIRLLVVDDSKVFCGIITKVLSKETDLNIVGVVHDGREALAFIKANRPDIVTLDVEMPGMNGIATLRSIQQFNAANPNTAPIGVIMLSSHTRKGADITISALEAGAFDFVTKPHAGGKAENFDMLRNSLATKIRVCAVRNRKFRMSATAAAPLQSKEDGASCQPGGLAPTICVGDQRVTMATVNAAGTPSPVPLAQATPSVTARKPAVFPLPSSFVDKPLPPHRSHVIGAVAIGVSTGGPNALGEMLPVLCEKIDQPIFIVQHMPPVFTKSMADHLNKKCRHTVVEAVTGEAVKPLHAYIAPGGRHMILRRQGTDVLITLHDQPPENGCRPSVDVLFRSVANLYKNSVTAIVLTGMGFDGMKGAATLKRAGAKILVQDEATSVVWGMPGSVAMTGNADAVLPLMDIPDAVKRTLPER